MAREHEGKPSLSPSLSRQEIKKPMCVLTAALHMDFSNPPPEFDKILCEPNYESSKLSHNLKS